MTGTGMLRNCNGKPFVGLPYVRRVSQFMGSRFPWLAFRFSMCFPCFVPLIPCEFEDQIQTLEAGNCRRRPRRSSKFELWNKPVL